MLRGGKSMYRYASQGGTETLCFVACGEGGQKLPKLPFDNFWKAPWFTRLVRMPQSIINKCTYALAITCSKQM